jgi:dUTP pyrophosphatase
MKIDFIKTHPDAKLPAKNNNHGSEGDAGFDLFAVEKTIIHPGESAIVPVGLKLAYVSPGYFFRIEARSGLGFKKGLQPHFGIIDNGYRGDLGVKIYNLSNATQVIDKGNGVAQIIPYVMLRCETRFAEKAAESTRGEKGFGSSDKENTDD